MTTLAPLESPAAPAVVPAVADPTSPGRVDRRGPFRPERLASTRERLNGRLIVRLFQGLDAILLVAGVALTGLFAGRTEMITATAAALGALAALGLVNSYGFSRRSGLAAQWIRVTLAALAGEAAALALLSPSVPVATLTRFAALWTPLSVASLLAAHGIWWSLIQHWRAQGRLTPNIVVVGATRSAERLVAALLSRREVNVLGVFDDRLGRAPGSVLGVPVLGDTPALLGHRIMPFVDRIVISVPPTAQKRVRALIERLAVLPNAVALLLDGDPDEAESAAMSRIADVPLALISGPPDNAIRALAKRVQDLVIASIAMLVAAPVLAAVALAVRLDSPGPIFFRQRRHGFNNEEIVVWKFRSMRIETQDDRATRQVSADDDRITRVGRFIRRTSLDELPQILNVLKGEMSLVGPRPHAIGMMTGDVESARLVAEYAHRHRMKPGITGWAAIHGSRGPIDTPADVRRRVALDVEYIERQSFWLDLYIMAMTLPCLLGDKDAVR